MARCCGVSGIGGAVAAARDWCVHVAQRAGKAAVGTSAMPDRQGGMLESGKAVLLPLKVPRQDSEDTSKGRGQHCEFLQKFWQHIVMRSIQLGGGKELLLSCNTSTGCHKDHTCFRTPALLLGQMREGKFHLLLWKR